jgi:hypothetical protein
VDSEDRYQFSQQGTQQAICCQLLPPDMSQFAAVQ